MTEAGETLNDTHDRYEYKDMSELPAQMIQQSNSHRNTINAQRLEQGGCSTALQIGDQWKSQQQLAISIHEFQEIGQNTMDLEFSNMFSQSSPKEEMITLQPHIGFLDIWSTEQC